LRDTLAPCGEYVAIATKATNREGEKTMIARFDHRPMLTAALALATIVLLVVVVTLSALLITAPPAVAPASVGDNSPVIGAGGEFYGDEWNNYGHDFDQPKPAQTGDGSVNDHFGRM
jgi:hypothetical protein